MDVVKSSFEDEAVPTVDQIHERAASMAKVVDSFLRGKAPPSARHEAAAAMSDVRAFVRAWRVAGVAETTAAGHNEDTCVRPSADVLLKLAQRGVQLHNVTRKLPQAKESGVGTGNDWKSATVAYLRATAASLVSLGSTSSSKDCANLCRLFSKAGEMLVEAAGDDIRALEMFDDAEVYFERLPGSFYGATGGKGADRLSLSAEDLVMAMHKASSRRVEVLSRTTGNVDQMVRSYEKQLSLLSKCAPAGLTVTTAMHAASLAEQRCKSEDFLGSSRLLRISLRALGGDLGESMTEVTAAHAGLRRTITYSLAYCCSQSGAHKEAIRCIKHLEDERLKTSPGSDDTTKFLFAKCKVLCDTGNLMGACEAAEALIEIMPSPDAETSDGAGLDLATAQMVASRDECSDRSLGLFTKIAARFPGSRKAVDARVALLGGLGMAARLRGEGCGAGISPSGGDAGDRVEVLRGQRQVSAATCKAAEMAEHTAVELIAGGGKVDSTKMTTSQVEESLQEMVSFAEWFQGREEWEACAKWCGLAITLARRLTTEPLYSAASGGKPSPTLPEKSAAARASLMLASLLTLRGEMETRMEDFSSSSQSLDEALELCPAYGRAREVAFWSAARDPARDESSLSARLSALSGPLAGLDDGARRKYLTTCAAIVAGTTKADGQRTELGDAKNYTTVWDNRVMMVQERLLEVLLGNPAIATPAPIQAPPPLATSTNEGDSDYVGSPMPNAVASKECVDLRDMEIDGAEDSDSSDVTLERQVAGGLRTMSVATADDGGSVRFGAVQVVASMVDRALKEAGSAAGEESSVIPSGDALNAGASSGKTHPTRTEYSVLSRVMISVDKALSSAASLRIEPSDDPDIDFLAKGCWNLAVRCCGPQCDLPWAVEVSRQTIQEGSDEHGFASHGRRGQASEPASKGLLVLAPGFFKASRQWTEMKLNANSADALLARQNCMVLGIATALEMYDSKTADTRSSLTTSPSLDDRKEDHAGIAHSSRVLEASRRAMLERCRKEVEAAIGLNRRLSDVSPDMAVEMRSVLLVAEISVLGRLGDAAAVRSLVASREADFRRCSTSLLHYCVQVAEDILEDSQSIAGLCRLCIRRCAEDDPVDTTALGALYRRLLMCSLSREDALVVADDFVARARDLEEGPGMKSDDVDYMAAKCYNLGLQLLEMGRPTAAERFVGKALGLLKLGPSDEFFSRWGETIHKVYRSTLQAKGDDTKTGQGRGAGYGQASGGSARVTGDPLRAGGSCFSTGLFPMPG